jgi:hypothetical protein
LKQENFCEGIPWDEVTQSIALEAGDESDDSEISDVEGEADDESDEPLVVPLI